MQTTTYFLMLSLALTATACGSSSASTPPDNSHCVVATTDGTTSCANTTCAAGQWCNEILCLQGCQTTANCASGMVCDKRGSTDANGAGACRTLPAECSAVRPDVGVSTCEPVGNYTATLRSGQPTACAQFITRPVICSITGSGSSLSANCDGATFAFSFNSASCTGSGNTQIQGNTVTYTLNITTNRLSATGGGVLCELDVVRN